jgi:hypothetical protein
LVVYALCCSQWQIWAKLYSACQLWLCANFDCMR